MKKIILIALLGFFGVIISKDVWEDTYSMEEIIKRTYSSETREQQCLQMAKMFLEIAKKVLQEKRHIVQGDIKAFLNGKIYFDELIARCNDDTANKFVSKSNMAFFSSLDCDNIHNKSVMKEFNLFYEWLEKLVTQK